MLLVVQDSCSVFRNDALGFNRNIGCCQVSVPSGSIGSAIIDKGLVVWEMIYIRCEMFVSFLATRFVPQKLPSSSFIIVFGENQGTNIYIYIYVSSTFLLSFKAYSRHSCNLCGVCHYCYRPLIYNGAEFHVQIMLRSLRLSAKKAPYNHALFPKIQAATSG